MATRHVLARIVDGDQLVDASVRRPVRLTPNGYAGVVYAGAVYPLFLDDLVDVGGSSWEIEDCNRFLLVGTDVPYARRSVESSPPAALDGFGGPWTVETSEFGHYVVFDADEREAGSVVEKLEAAGLAVQRWDVSHRPARDGRFYDWFARLRSRADHHEVVSRVTEALAGQASALVQPVGRPAVPRVEELEARIEELLGLSLDLRARLEVAMATETRLRQRLDAESKRQTGLIQELDRALKHHSALYEQIADLRESTDQDVAVRAMLTEQLATEELLELALAENAELWRDRARAQDAAQDDEQRVLILEATLQETQDRLDEVREQQREQRRAKTAGHVTRRGVEGFLSTAFARLDLVLESAQVLANLDAPTAVLRCLVQIDRGELLGRDLEGFRGWREVSKLATGLVGLQDMGRVYYKPDGGRVLVSVHVKHNDKEQRRHLERLRLL